MSSLLLSREADRVRELERDRLFLLVVVDLPRDRPLSKLLPSFANAFITSLSSMGFICVSVEDVNSFSYCSVRTSFFKEPRRNLLMVIQIASAQ